MRTVSFGTVLRRVFGYDPSMLHGFMAGVYGSTGAVLDRTIERLSTLTSRSLDEANAISPGSAKKR
jgi:hypothetical protein